MPNAVREGTERYHGQGNDEGGSSKFVYMGSTSRCRTAGQCSGDGPCQTLALFYNDGCNRLPHGSLAPAPALPPSADLDLPILGVSLALDSKRAKIRRLTGRDDSARFGSFRGAFHCGHRQRPTETAGDDAGRTRCPPSHRATRICVERTQTIGCRSLFHPSLDRSPGCVPALPRSLCGMSVIPLVITVVALAIVPGNPKVV